MYTRTVLSVLLIVGLLVPAAGASVAPASQPLDEGSPATAVAEDGDDSGSSSAANYTQLFIDDRYQYLRIKPGSSDSVTVTVENIDDEAVTITPHLVRSNPSARSLDDAWVDIDVEERTLEPGEELEVTVTVDVPEGTEIGEYRTRLALTDETITYPGRPARPVHASTLNVQVWREPTVYVRTGRYFYSQIEAGESATHQIVVENTGDEAVPLSPELLTERRGRYPPGNAVERSWFEIEAPNEVPAGETATVNVTITPPTDADRGRYDAELDLGLKDPARAERDTYWQEIDLNFQVWKQPDEPFTTAFTVSEATENLTLTLSPRNARYSDDDEPAQFDVAFVAPDGTVVEAERVSVADRGFVDLSGDRRERATGDEEYLVRGNGQEFVYRLDEPMAGQWTLRVMPHNTVGFSYEIVRDESAD